MKVLAAIANYGPYRFGYLDRVLHAYRRMPCRVDVVVHSDRPKRIPQWVELAVGLPSADPHSLPFAHKTLFAERARDYDLFVYSEDDILIEWRQVAAFSEVAGVLPESEVPGFFRYERGPDGRRWYADAHPPYDWVPGSVRQHCEHVFASFSNQHSGCYALTRSHLAAAVRSGGYLVPPHRTWYEMRESAATDPYSQCGLVKRLCLSHWDDQLVHHLPNNYVGVVGTGEDALRDQIDALLRSVERSLGPAARGR